MDIPFDAQVYCSDGLYGRSTRVVLNPIDRRVTQLVVKEERQPQTERMLPFKYVVETTADEIHLNCTKENASRAQSFEIFRYVPLLAAGPDAYLTWSFGYMADYNFLRNQDKFPIKHTAIPQGELAVYRNARVKAINGTVGRLREFLVDTADGQITHLVLREGHIWGQEEVTISVSEIDRLDEETVYLKLDKRAIAALPAVPIRRFARKVVAYQI